MFGHSKQSRFDRSNDRLSGRRSTRGSLEQLDSFFLDSAGVLCNFAVSGGEYREKVLNGLLRMTEGRLPVLIIHNHNDSLAQAAMDCWSYTEGQASSSAMWRAENGKFEPFLGMSEIDIITVLRAMATRLEYTCTPELDRVVRGHLKILELLGSSPCLSGLFYLCSFTDMRLFHDNIFSLNCSDAQRNSIWSDLGVEAAGEGKQFELFRSVIGLFAHEAEACGWVNDGNVGSMNLSTAIKDEKTITMLWPVDGARAKLMLDYIYQELIINNQQECMVIFDGLSLGESRIPELINSSGYRMHFGLSSENLVQQLGGNEQEVLRNSQKIERFVFLRHNVASTAAVLSELIGKSDISQVSWTKENGRGFLHLLPDYASSSYTVSSENRYRVMPEEFLSLKGEQAILFNTHTNEVLFLN